MKGQLAAAAEVPRTPRANEDAGASPWIIEERWTRADIRPELAPVKAGNPTTGTIYAHVDHLTAVTSEVLPDQGAASRIIKPVEFRRVAFHQGRGSFTTLQRWEGTVIQVEKESFTARLYDKSATHADEEGDFSLEEVSPADRDLVMPGAVFYWSVGYLDHRNGQRTRESLIRFRRLPAWNKRELDEARDRAKKILHRIGPSDWQRAT